MSDLNIVFAGFGGQGVLFAGKVVAYAGLMDGKHVSWLPSYGPEMRGGTANCSVCVSDDPIGSPLVVHPDVLVAMNLPSFEKFIDTVKPGGTVIVDSTLVNAKTERTDINAYYIPATKLADEKNFKGLSNMILLGKLFGEIDFLSKEGIEKGIRKSIPPRKQNLLEANLKAIAFGADQ